MDFLVIDDDKTFRDATCMLIEAEGHGAEGAEDGVIGMERVRGESFDAVLLDVNLGALNGLDLLPEIAKAKPNLPVVLFTAGGSIKTAVEAMRRGAVDFLEKPFTREQLLTGYRQAQAKGVKRFGLHTMVASNELDPRYFVETAQLLFDLVVELKTRTGISIEFVNLGGGIGIPYKPEQTCVDLALVGREIRAAYEKTINAACLPPLRLVMECGRMITGPYGYLVSRVQHKKSIYKNYVGLDACMANLMRPGMYGSYHHVTVPAREGGPRKVYDVTGSLCENNDKFAIDREIPDPQPGDLVVIHDTGAHGHAMGFNYNGKLRSAELLWSGDAKFRVIRRAETLADHFATLDFPGLSGSNGQ